MPRMKEEEDGRLKDLLDMAAREAYVTPALLETIAGSVVRRNEDFPRMGVDRADKDARGKTMIAALPAAVTALLARIYDYGAKKYKLGSWRKGFPDSELASALERHYLLWRAGERVDTESQEPHLGHLAWNALTLWLQQETGKGARDLDMDAEELEVVRKLLYGRPVVCQKNVLGELRQPMSFSARSGGLPEGVTFEPCTCGGGCSCKDKT